MSTLDTLKLISPELATTYTDDQLLGFIALAEPQIGPRFCNRSLAVAYLAAHTATIAGRRGIGGAVTSLSEGSLSIGATAVGYGELSTTGYGVEFERLKRQCIFAARNKMVR